MITAITLKLFDKIDFNQSIFMIYVAAIATTTSLSIDISIAAIAWQVAF